MQQMADKKSWVDIRTKLRTYSTDLDCAEHQECTSQSALRSAAAQNAVTATSCIRQYSSATIIANWLCRAAASNAKTIGSTALDLKKILEIKCDNHRNRMSKGGFANKPFLPAMR